jgi:NADPH:quinone reductase
MPRVWRIHDYIGFDGLVLEDEELENPGPGQIRLKVQAFSLNWGDMDLMKDNYSFSFSAFPARVGIEAAGVIDAIGPGVTHHKIGDRVATLPYFYDRRGVSGDYAIVDARYLAPTPDALTAVEAASVWMQYMTAYFPMAEISKVGPGSNVLVTAATGTAGAAALEIGRGRGATMIGTTRDARNTDYLRSLGADHVIVTGQEDLGARLREVTGGKGIDVAFDPVGAGLIAHYAKALARNARFYFYGTLDTQPPTLPLVDMFQANAVFHPYSLFNYVEDDDMRARGVAFVHGALSAGTLKPRIDRVYPMEGYHEAFDYLRQPRTNHGKVVIETGL